MWLTINMYFFVRYSFLEAINPDKMNNGDYFEITVSIQYHRHTHSHRLRFSITSR
jgi:hypothetical protein